MKGTLLPMRDVANSAKKATTKPRLEDCIDPHIARQIQDLDAWYAGLARHIRENAKFALILLLILVR
jgi:hypothetical protein